MPKQSLNEMTKADLIAELERYRQFDHLLDATESAAHIGHYEWDYQNDRLGNCSREYARLFGMTRSEVMESESSWEKSLEKIHIEDREEYRLAAESNTHTLDLQYRIFRKDGEIRYIREIGVISQDQRSNHLSSFGILQDITEQEKYRRDLEHRDRVAQQTELITEIGCFIFNMANERYEYISPGFARIHGVTCEQYLERVQNREDDMSDVHADDYDRLMQIYLDHQHQKREFNVEYRIHRADGEIRWIRELSRAYSLEEGNMSRSIGVLQDITAQKINEKLLISIKEELETTVEERTQELAESIKQLKEEVVEREKIAAELKFLANHDALTGLPSIRLGKDRLERSIIESRRTGRHSSVMFIDLDGFKDINDNFGHDVGDTVLKVTAERLKAEIRESDTVARIGGDEFLVIVTGIPEKEIITKLAPNLIEQINQTIHVEGQNLHIGGSIGIAMYPEDGSTAEELIRKADGAMYRVKHSGKNGFSFAKNEPLN